MAISDLKARQGNVDLELDIMDVGEARTFDKFGKSGKVANATGKDASGTIKLSLWNEQVEQVKAGDRIKITNGWVSEWQGELQLSTGKFGKLEIVGKVESDAQAPAETIVAGGGSEMSASGETPQPQMGMPEEEFLDEQEE